MEKNPMFKFFIIPIKMLWVSTNRLHLPPITKTIPVRRTRHAGHCWRSRDELIGDVLLWTTTYIRAKAGRPARTYIQQLCRIWNVVLKTYQRQCTIRRSGERGSGISVLAARHNDDYSISNWNGDRFIL